MSGNSSSGNAKNASPGVGAGVAALKKKRKRKRNRNYKKKKSTAGGASANGPSQASASSAPKMQKRKAVATPTIADANSNWIKMKGKVAPQPTSESAKKRRKKMRAKAEKKAARKKASQKTTASSSSSLVSTYLLDAVRTKEITDTVAMDCEMVGVGFKQLSAVARCTIVNYYGQVLYDEFCRPNDRITDYRTRWSGIRHKDLVGARPFSQLQQEVADILKGKILIGHGLENDLKSLMLTHPRSKIRDSAHWMHFKIKRAKGLKAHSRKLKDLAKEFFDWDIQEGEHSPVVDARAALAVYKKHAKAWERDLRTRKQRKPTIEENAGVSANDMGNDAGDLFAGAHKRRRTK